MVLYPSLTDVVTNSEQTIVDVGVIRFTQPQPPDLPTESNNYLQNTYFGFRIPFCLRNSLKQDNYVTHNLHEKPAQRAINA